MLNEGLKKIVVVRFQGGSNAGHTVVSPDGTKIALHQVPSCVLYKEAVGIMESGMVIHMEDLKTEIEEAEEIEEVGDLNGRLYLSEMAMLCTDLERAQEVLNRNLSSGKSEGGTGRGIAPTVANAITRRGALVGDLFEDEWEAKFEKMYEDCEKEFAAHGYELAEIEVPDLKATRAAKKAISRTLGNKEEFIERLEEVRDWFIERDELLPGDETLVCNTFVMYENWYQDENVGFLFEGAQAIGLHPVFGRYPDITSTHTDTNGVLLGTKFPGFARECLEEIIGVMKLTYTSSVAKVHMLTDSGIERRIYTEDEISEMDPAEGFAAWVRNEAHEFGTTTGRVRDIRFLDLALLRYNIAIGGIKSLAATHADIARPTDKIRVCMHYADHEGKYVPYQPGIQYQQGLVPVYIELPGWDGATTQEAESFDELPENCQKFIKFVERSLSIEIKYITTGPNREQMIVK
ncbi:MAG: adenylosuccinate synthase [Candidatus Dojkabacteria bacterium]